MRIGVNSVLFGGFDLRTAFETAALCGYDGIELSAIEGMSEHLVLDRWQELVEPVRRLAAEYDLPVLAIEQPRQDSDAMERAFQAAAALECPIVNCGPGGTSGDSLQQTIDSLAKLAERAAAAGVTLCVKAHVGRAVFDTPTTLQLLEAITHPAFGLDMDPSHIHRAGEDTVAALRSVVDRVKHVHVRDCLGRESGPGEPALQACGRGDIDLLGFVAVLHEAGYTGPVDLEVIGAREHALSACVAIAAESRGYLQAALQACGAR